MKQGTKEWHEARAGRITASRAAAALGESPWQTPYDLIRDMVRDYHGALDEFGLSAPVHWGVSHEPVARLEYMHETGRDVEDAGFFVHPEHDWLGASPDGLVGDDGLLEIKCPYSLRHRGEFKSLRDQIHYWIQMQVQMACTSRSWTDFYQWTPHSTSLERVHFDPEWFEKALPKLQALHERYLAELDNPEHLEDKRKTLAGKKYERLVERYERLKEIQDEAKAEQREILDKLVDAAGGKDSEVCGRKLTKVERAGSVSYARIVKEHLPEIDLEEYRGKSSSYWRLS